MERMRVRVRKWGNSLALRIPTPFAEDAAVREGAVVDLSVSEGKLVATPIRRKRVTLKELVAKVNKRNLHGDVESGPPVGLESL
jgi:antitoxin MazE